MSDAQKNTLEQLLKSIGLASDFFEQLRNESDWAMVIKLHAIFEAVLADLIAKRLDKPELRTAVSHLDFNHTKAGKVVFAHQLGLLHKQHTTFLRGLSELRNQLVHNIKNVSFSFVTYVSGLSKSELKEFRTKFGAPLLRIENGEMYYKEYLELNPKFIVHLAARDCLLALQFSVAPSTRNRLAELLMSKTK